MHDKSQIQDNIGGDATSLDDSRKQDGYSCVCGMNFVNKPKAYGRQAFINLALYIRQLMILAKW